MVTDAPAAMPIEQEANQFAMELLMPTAWLREDARKLGGIDIGDNKALDKLARRYGVSPELMAFRLGQLTEF